MSTRSQWDRTAVPRAASAIFDNATRARHVNANDDLDLSPLLLRVASAHRGRLSTRVRVGHGRRSMLISSARAGRRGCSVGKQTAGKPRPGPLSPGRPPGLSLGRPSAPTAAPPLCYSPSLTFAVIGSRPRGRRGGGRQSRRSHGPRALPLTAPAVASKLIAWSAGRLDLKPFRDVGGGSATLSTSGSAAFSRGGCRRGGSSTGRIGRRPCPAVRGGPLHIGRSNPQPPLPRHSPPDARPKLRQAPPRHQWTITYAPLPLGSAAAGPSRCEC
jgi:hypothetical protein